MKLLLVISVDPWTRSVSTVHKYAAAARSLGHEVAVYGPAHAELPGLPFTTELEGVDLALFVVQVPADFPDMPYLARLLDGIPRERRAVVDLWGRFNDTIRLEHDFNHLEKVDGHQGWEWQDAIRAVSDTILQPTLAPLRPNVRPFLFHGYDPGSVVRPFASARRGGSGVACGGAALRRDVCRQQLAAMGPGPRVPGGLWLRPEASRKGVPGRLGLGRATRVGRAVRNSWGSTPIRRCWRGSRWRCATASASTRLSACSARPGLLRSSIARYFATWASSRTGRSRPSMRTRLPVLMLPRDFVKAIYGDAALALVPSNGVAEHLADAMRRPEAHWDAVLKTRSHLERHHSYARRFEELAALPTSRKASGRAR